MSKRYGFLILGIFMLGIVMAQKGSTPQTLARTQRLKETTEFSLGLGTRFLTGDITTSLGLDLSAELRRSLDHVFSIRGGLHYFPDNSLFSVNRPANIKRDPRLDIPQNVNSGRIVSEGYQANLELMVALNQLAARKTRRFTIYGFIGAGGMLSQLTLYSEGTEPINLAERIGLNKHFFTVCMNGGGGFGFRLSDRISLYLEHRSSYMFGSISADLHDGFVFSTVDQRSSLTDFYHVDRLRVAINLGRMPKRSLPFWWISPLDKINKNLAEIKARSPVDLTDSDKDGVIDVFDLEPYSEKGALVDTRGITLDSDQDGIADHKDLEPYSPIGSVVNKQGIAQKTSYDYNKKQLESDLDDRLGTLESNKKASWFLPLILFDVKSPIIREPEFAKLSQVAVVLDLHPDYELVIKGFANMASTSCEQAFLSYLRAKSVHDYLILKHKIAPERLFIHYGEDPESSLPHFTPKSIYHRVEFFVRDTEKSMAPPPNCN